jgi:hypothetical protein
MKVELFYTPGCEKCADSKDKLKALATDLVPLFAIAYSPATAPRTNQADQ